MPGSLRHAGSSNKWPGRTSNEQRALIRSTLSITGMDPWKKGLHPGGGGQTMSTSTSSHGAAGQTKATSGRWGLVAAALLLQFSIGAVYAWSVFSKALQNASAFNLTKVEAALPFEVTIGMIFVGTYVGGRIQDRRGPRIVALAGGVIYAVGILVASLAHDRS